MISTFAGIANALGRASFGGIDCVALLVGAESLGFVESLAWTSMTGGRSSTRLAIPRADNGVQPNHRRRRSRRSPQRTLPVFKRNQRPFQRRQPSAPASAKGSPRYDSKLVLVDERAFRAGSRPVRTLEQGNAIAAPGAYIVGGVSVDYGVGTGTGGRRTKTSSARSARLALGTYDVISERTA